MILNEYYMILIRISIPRDSSVRPHAAGHPCRLHQQDVPEHRMQLHYHNENVSRAKQTDCTEPRDPAEGSRSTSSDEACFQPSIM
jgi:hypothetical protein